VLEDGVTQPVNLFAQEEWPVRSRGETALYNALYIALRERARTRDSEELSRRAIVL
jgi:hypothetical protein